MTTDTTRIVKTGICPSLSGKSKLTYEVGAGADSNICVRITKNSGAGMLGKGWVETGQVRSVAGRWRVIR